MLRRPHVSKLFPYTTLFRSLFLESIGKAEHSIYIENQFLSSMKIARALAERLRQRPGLELLMVAPKSHDSWLEAHSMRNGRIRDRKSTRLNSSHPSISYAVF